MEFVNISPSFHSAFDFVHFGIRILPGCCIYDLSVGVEYKKIGNVFFLKIKSIFVRLQFAFVKKYVGQQLGINILYCLSLRCTSRSSINPGEHWNEIDVDVVTKTCQYSAGFLNELFKHRLK